MTINKNVAKNKEFKINLVDLPHGRLYVKIDEILLNKILIELNNKFGSINKARNSLKIIGSFYGWKYRKEFPLFILIKLLKISNIPMHNIHKHVIGLKTGIYNGKLSGNLSKSIKVKFPIILNKELARIIAHFFGDGCINIDKKRYFHAAYYNQEKNMRESFKQDINKVFGINELKEGVNKTTSYILLPSPIALILLQKVNSFSSKKCRIPYFIKHANFNIKKEFIKTFFDDECYIRYAPPSRYIEITICNKLFLEDLKSLIEEFGIETTKIFSRIIKSKFAVHTFYIRGFNNINKFISKIGSNNPKNIKKLQSIIDNPGRIYYSHGQTKQKIVTLLNKQPLTSTKLSKILNRKRCTINHFLGKLKKENKIKQVGKKGKHIIWSKK